MEKNITNIDIQWLTLGVNFWLRSVWRSP